ncbi:MAG: hypothetical protein AB1483_07615 [Candidatus Zixiibacteriota bacterium]
MRKRVKRQPPVDSLGQPNHNILTTPFMVVVALYFAGSFFPGRLTWGFSYWSLWPLPVAVGAFVIAAIMLRPGVANPIALLLGRVCHPAAAMTGKVKKPVSMVLLFAAAVLVLFYFRSRGLVYGDGYAVLNDTTSGDDVVLLDQYYLQILAVYFNHYAYAFLDAVVPWTAQDKIALIKAVGGAVGLWAIFRIARQITTDGVSRAFVTVGALSSGSVILFFGYIENYTWATALALWALSFSIGFVRRENGVAGMVICAVLAFFFHMATLPIAVVVLISLFMRGSPSGNFLLDIGLKKVAAFFAVFSGIFVTVSQLLDIEIFVPLWATRGNPYSAFSAAHLIDVANQMLLVAPLGVLLLIFTAAFGRKLAFAVSEEDGILCMSAWLMFLVSFWVDPEIGAPRDWDLLSFYGIPLTMWGLYRFTKFFRQRQIPSIYAVAATVVAVFTLLPNLYEKQSLQRSVSRLDMLLAEDPHYQSTYQLAERCMPWVAILQQGADEEELAVKYLHRRLLAVPDEYKACFTLGDIYRRRGIYDSASIYLRRGAHLKPDEMQMILTLAKLERHLERYAESIKWAARAVELSPMDVDALTELGIALSERGYPERSLPHFQRAFSIAPSAYDQQVNLGMCHAMTGTIDSAYYYIAMAFSNAASSRRPELCYCLISAALELNLTADASRYLDTLRRIDPSSPHISSLGAQLAAAQKR